MHKYDEKKAKEIRNTIERAFLHHVYNERMRHLIVSDLKTNEYGDVWVTIDVVYEGKNIPVIPYFIWDSEDGWCDTIYETTRAVAHVLKWMRLISEYWMRDRWGKGAKRKRGIADARRKYEKLQREKSEDKA